MALITITNTYLIPPLLTAIQHATTTSAPGTPEQAAANYLAAHPQYQEITDTHLRYYEKHETVPANANLHRPIVPGTWEIIDVRFTDNSSEEPLQLSLFEEHE